MADPLHDNPRSPKDDAPEWTQNVTMRDNPNGPYGDNHPREGVGYEEVPAEFTKGIDADDWSHTTKGDKHPRYWRPKSKPTS